MPTTAPVAGGGTPQQAATVLVVEDEPAIATAIAQRLSAEGWRVEVARDGLSAVDAATRLRPDAIVLDVMLPGIDGLEVTRRIQAEQPVPILMLTARDDETDMLIGLGVGADDYMTKPFSMRELVARIKALLRRVDRATQAASSAPSDPPMTVGDVTIDKAQRRVYRAGEEVHLTPTEFELLVMLASSPKTVLTRERLLAEVWTGRTPAGRAPSTPTSRRCAASSVRTSSARSTASATRSSRPPDDLPAADPTDPADGTDPGQAQAPGPARPAPHRAHTIRPHLPDVRPLDSFRSLKIKLGVLVAATVTLAVLITWIGLQNQLGPSRTFPLAIVLSLLLTQPRARHDVPCGR